MHECALALELLDLVEREARARGARRVLRVALAVGRLSGADPEALGLAFQLIARGTLAEGACLDLERVPGRGECPVCGRRVPVREVHAACPVCRAGPLRLVAGRELRLTALVLA